MGPGSGFGSSDGIGAAGGAAGAAANGAGDCWLAMNSSNEGEVITPAQCGQGPVVGGSW